MTLWTEPRKLIPGPRSCRECCPPPPSCCHLQNCTPSAQQEDSRARKTHQEDNTRRRGLKHGTRSNRVCKRGWGGGQQEDRAQGLQVWQGFENGGRQEKEDTGQEDKRRAKNSTAWPRGQEKGTRLASVARGKEEEKRRTDGLPQKQNKGPGFGSAARG